MSEMMKIAVPAIAVAIILGAAGYFYLRSLRGSLTLVQAGVAHPGQTVEGRVDLLVKTDLPEATLVVRLVGEEITRESRGDRDYEGVREFYRQEQTLEGPRVFFPGEPLSRTFSLPLPPKEDWPLTVELTQVEWRLEAKLLTEGIDLWAETVVTLAP